MRGKRVTAMRRTGKYTTKRRGTAETGSGMARLTVCAVIVVLVIAASLLFPGKISAFTRNISDLVGVNADFSEAFASVGRAVSGENDVGQSLQDAFQAVFAPSEIRDMDSGNMRKSSEPDAQSVGLSAAAVDTQKEKTEEQTQEIADLSGLYTMQSLPENASLEQRNLGFPCTTPVIGVLSSPFGWREHPTEGGTKFHYGIDLAAEKGSEIVAFADGEVFAVGESSTLGKYLIVTHAGGYRTLYAHCSEIVVKSGSVRMGDLIARVGESGSATGAHLHFELQDGTLYLNPIYYVALG